MFYRYDTYFIDQDKLSDFSTWAKIQNFYGRWMPEKRDCIHFRLNEYAWCSTYRNLNIEWSEHPGQKCPCSVTPTTITHLQENFCGLDGDQFGHTTALPCEDLFTKMNLHILRHRGVILNEINEPSLIDIGVTSKRANGLYIRKDILDNYLEAEGKSLVMCVLGGKEIIAGVKMLNNKDISGYYYYDPMDGYKGDVRFVENKL